MLKVSSTRSLDASTALEDVQSLRSLTSMANVLCAVALYQARGEVVRPFSMRLCSFMEESVSITNLQRMLQHILRA